MNELHIADAEKTQMEAQVAQQLAKGKHSLVQMMAEKNTALTEDISFLATHLDDLTKRKKDVVKETKRLQDNYQISKQRIELVGFDGLQEEELLGHLKDLQLR